MVIIDKKTSWQDSMQTILGQDKQAFVKKLNIRKAFCIAIALVAVVLNVVFTLLRNDQNHTLMLILNVVVDVAVGWFLVYYVSFNLIFYQKMLQLYCGNKSYFKGVVASVSTQTQRVQGFDCYSVTVGEQDARTFFLPDCFDLQLDLGAYVTIGAVANVIVEVSV